MRRILALSLLVALCGAAPGADAQTKPRPRPQPAAPKPVVVPPPKAQTTPIRPISPSPFDAGPACRAQCSKDRYSCHVEDEASDCDGRWLTCLAACRTR